MLNIGIRFRKDLYIIFDRQQSDSYPTTISQPIDNYRTAGRQPSTTDYITCKDNLYNDIPNVFLLYILNLVWSNCSESLHLCPIIY